MNFFNRNQKSQLDTNNLQKEILFLIEGLQKTREEKNIIASLLMDILSECETLKRNLEENQHFVSAVKEQYTQIINHVENLKKRLVEVSEKTVNEAKKRGID